MKPALLVALAAVTIVFAVVWVRDLRGRWGPRQAADSAGVPSPGEVLIGAVTNFFDTLGIGSYAPTTSAFRFFRAVPDTQIPGTLNVGHTIPSLVEAVIFVAIVEVDMATLVALIGAAVAGAWLGAGVVVRMPKQKIQIGMGAALVGAAGFMLMAQLHVLPGGGDATGLSLHALLVGCAANFVFGALMNLGIGLFAPCMVVVALLGMSPKAAFPIMMGSCAFLMPLAGTRFIAHKRYAPRAALGLTLGGIPAVLVAAFIVKSLPLDVLRWLVVAVILYTAVVMMRSAREERERVR